MGLETGPETLGVGQHGAATWGPGQTCGARGQHVGQGAATWGTGWPHEVEMAAFFQLLEQVQEGFNSMQTKVNMGRV